MRTGFCVFLLCLASPMCRASIFDMIPVVSQMKSLVQVIAGDAEGARQTQENFADFMPVVSQVKSLVHAAADDEDAARRTQQRFLNNMESIADSTPLIGQVKGITHIAVGDEERGVEIIKGATSSTGALIGGVFGGPAGAVVGNVAADGLITAIQSVENGKHSPYGTIDYVANIDKKDPGEHFDVWAGVGMDVGGGVLAKKAAGKTPRKAIDEFGGDLPRGRLDEHFIHQWGPDDMEISLSPRTTLEIARSRVGHLSDMYKKRLELVDFKDVNDVDGMTNCYMCTAAAKKGMSVTELVETYQMSMDQVWRATGMDDIVKIYQRVGYPEAKLAYHGNIRGLYEFLDNNVNHGTKIYALAYDFADKPGHVVLLRAWRESNRYTQTLITDFQKTVPDPSRFRTNLNQPDAKSYYLVDFGNEFGKR
ncbi:Hypothetical protein NTJ_12716 [Nesidiocoris tenuis]|uniref:Uncharacterized protein n=1 Tax=Nesidiocoris tenuis TaxID=355587 RepID=A0ABN7B660_9HEMI|nr:Hypothetical protein NTJ_12716 [Nesidiocoris tenuis]